MGRHPELRSALPTTFVKRRKTAKLLTPTIVLTTVVILVIASIVGVAVTGSVFDSKGVYAGEVEAAGAFLLIAVSALFQWQI